MKGHWGQSKSRSTWKRPLSWVRALPAGLSLGAIAWGIAAQPVQADCSFFSEPQRYNTEMRGDVIVIGAQRDRSYRVIIVGNDRATLAAVRACVLDAFTTHTHFGTYIQVGSFRTREDAEIIRSILQREGFHPRVIYDR